MTQRITGFSDLRGRFEEYRFADAIAARVEWVEKRTATIVTLGQRDVPYEELCEAWFELKYKNQV